MWMTLYHHSDQLGERATIVTVFHRPSFKLSSRKHQLLNFSLSIFSSYEHQFVVCNFQTFHFHFLNTFDTWYGQNLLPKYFSGQTAAFPTWKKDLIEKPVKYFGWFEILLQWPLPQCWLQVEEPPLSASGQPHPPKGTRNCVPSQFNITITPS